MKTNLSVATFLMTSLAFTALTGCAGQTTNAQIPSPDKSPPTAFKCVSQNGQWVTLAEKGNLTSKPFFVWQTVEFGEKYTPNERCKIVSDKLTKIVQQNGGFLSDLSLSYGRVNGEGVICVSKDSCTESNMLFTLSQKDANNPQGILTQMIDFAQNKTSNPLVQSGGQTRILLEDLVKFEKL